MHTLNWCYGAKAPDVESAVDKAIYAAHKYRNDLCALELEKRKRHETLLMRLVPDYVQVCKDVEDLELELGKVRESIMALRKAQATKTPKGAEFLKACAVELKLKLKSARFKRKESKSAAYECDDVRSAIEVNNEEHKSACAKAKQDSGLYWPTEALIRASCSSFSSGAPPRFKRFNGEGQLALQLQKGLVSSAVLDAEDTRLRLLVPDDLQERLSVDGKASRKECRVHCLFRIGSEGRDPVFARVPIVFHRPLPNGKVKWAYLERRKVANRTKWSVRLTIDIEDRESSPIQKPSVALHVGWRMDGDKLRVCTWLSSDGRKGVLHLDANHLADYLILDSIKSDRALEFNDTKAQFLQWLKSKPTLPDDLQCKGKFADRWRSPTRMAAFAMRLRDMDLCPEWLDVWRKRDKRKWQHERRLSLRIVRRRRHLYRNFVSELKGDFDVALVAQIEAKKLTEHPQLEDDKGDDVRVRHAKIAAVSELVRFVREKFRLRTVDTDVKGITRTCSECGADNEVDSRVVRCKCGRRYDRDVNGAENTLARGLVMLKSGALLELQRAQEDAREKQRERLAKMQAANAAARKHKRKMPVCI